MTREDPNHGQDPGPRTRQRAGRALDEDLDVTGRQLPEPARTCEWAAIVRRLQWRPEIGKYRVIDGPRLQLRRARPRSCRRARS